MKRIGMTISIALCAALLLTSAAHAQVSLNSVRIGAKDTVALAKFYQTAFSMQEVFCAPELVRQVSRATYLRLTDISGRRLRR